MLTAELQHHSKFTQNLYVIMGVAGCGKTTIGEQVVQQLGGVYIDGDDLHPPANIDKMSRSEPLDDVDRFPWLQEIGKLLSNAEGPTFVGCSALKKAYRKLIIDEAQKPVCFIYLKGNQALIAERMAARQGHFMPTALLDSQFKALEEPQGSENFIEIDISKPLEIVVNDICQTIKERS